MGQLCEESYAEKEKRKPITLRDVTIIDDGKLRKAIPQHHWVMQWNGLILVFMVLCLRIR